MLLSIKTHLPLEQVHHTCWRWPLSSRRFHSTPPPSHFSTLPLFLFLTFSLFSSFNRVECFHLFSPPTHSTTILNPTNACYQLLFWNLIPTSVTSLSFQLNLELF
jgi:hypothetical protein